MNMTLSLPEFELSNNRGSEKFDTLERIALDVIEHGGTFTPTMCHDGSTRKTIKTREEFQSWLDDIKVRYQI